VAEDIEARHDSAGCGEVGSDHDIPPASPLDEGSTTLPQARGGRLLPDMHLHKHVLFWKRRAAARGRVMAGSSANRPRQNYTRRRSTRGGGEAGGTRAT